MASKSLGTLTVDLIAKVGGFMSGMSKAEREAERASKAVIASQKRMADRLNVIYRNIGSVAVAGFAAITGAAVALGLKMKSTIDAMDDMSKAAQRAGMSTESFSKLAYAGDLADVSIETLTKTMGKLAKSQYDAMTGVKETSDAFKAMGIEAIDPVTGKMRDGMAIIEEFADKFRDAGGSPEVMALGFKIFGRSFQDLIPLMKDGAAGIRAATNESDRFGFTISTVAGRSAEEFNDNIRRVEFAVQGLFNSLATSLLPALVETSSQFVDWSSKTENQKQMLDALSEGVQFLTQVVKWGLVAYNAFQIIWDNIRVRVELVVNTLGQAINQVANFGRTAISVMNGIKNMDPSAVFAAISNGMKTSGNSAKAYIAQQEVALTDFVRRTAKNAHDVSSILGNMDKSILASKRKTDVASMYGTMNDAIKSRKRWSPDIPTPKTGSSKSSSGGSSNSAERDLKEQQRMEEEARRELERQVQAVVDAKERFEEMAASLSGPVAAANYKYKKDMENLNELARVGEISTTALTQAQNDLTKAHQEDLKAIEERLDPGKQVLADLQFELTLLGKTREEQERLTLARRLDGAASKDAAVAALGQLQAAEESMRKQVEIADEIRGSFSGAFQDWVNGSKSFKDAFLGALDQINAKILSMIADNLMEKLFGGQGSALGGLFGGSSGGGGIAGFFSSLFGGGMATGGWALPNSIYEVNEKGPEFFSSGSKDYMYTGRQGVQVTPNHQLGGSFSQNNNFIIQGRIDRRTQEQIAMSTGRKAQEAQRRLA